MSVGNYNISMNLSSQNYGELTNNEVNSGVRNYTTTFNSWQEHYKYELYCTVLCYNIMSHGVYKLYSDATYRALAEAWTVS